MGNEYTSGVAMLVLYVRVIDVYVDELDPGQLGFGRIQHFTGVFSDTVWGKPGPTDSFKNTNCIICIHKCIPLPMNQLKSTDGDSAMWLPDWLYRALPYIYAAAGIASIYNGENALHVGSGLLLIFTAFLVWKLRSNIKQQTKRTGKPTSSHS